MLSIGDRCVVEAILSFRCCLALTLESDPDTTSNKKHFRLRQDEDRCWKHIVSLLHDRPFLPHFVELIPFTKAANMASFSRTDGSPRPTRTDPFLTSTDIPISDPSADQRAIWLCLHRHYSLSHFQKLVHQATTGGVPVEGATSLPPPPDVIIKSNTASSAVPIPPHPS